MIKGLYFKLNLKNSFDKEIYQFFTSEPYKQGINKIDLLSDMVRTYKDVKIQEDDEQ